MLCRKMVIAELQLQIESANIQTRHVPSGRSYASIIRTENKQSNNNQNNQKTLEKITTPIGTIYNKRYTGITKYDERIYGKNGRNV